MAGHRRPAEGRVHSQVQQGRRRGWHHIRLNLLQDGQPRRDQALDRGAGVQDHRLQPGRQLRARGESRRPL
eukprot:8699914-Pyramimonas_sp.AAC.1